MKRLTILGIIACVGLLFAPAVVFSNPAGPKEGLNVKIINPLPVPVTGDVEIINTDEDPVPVTIIDEESCDRELLVRRGAVYDQIEGLSIIHRLYRQGKVLVLETFSVRVAVREGINVYSVSLVDIDNPIDLKLTLAIPLHDQGPGKDNMHHYAATVTGKTYLKGGMYAVATRIAPDDCEGCAEEYVLSGYYVNEDCPQP
jgi:hypothetical protein